MRFLDKISRSGDRRIPSQVLIPSLVIVFTKLMNLFIFPAPTLHPDSTTYSAANSWNFELVSFFGESKRGWPVPLVYALLPNQTLQVFFQLSFSAVSWICLLFVVQNLLPNRASTWMFSIFMTVLAVSPLATQWDLVLLGTSMMLSCNLLIISLIIHIWTKPGSQFPYLILFILLDGLILLQKSSNLPLCLLYAGLVFLAPLKTVGRDRKNISLTLFTLVMTYGVIVGINVDKYWDFTYSGTTLLWQLGSQSPSAEGFKEYLKNENSVPECIYKSAPYRDINLEIVKLLSQCPEAKSYVRENLKLDFAKFVIKNPADAIKLLTVAGGAVSTTSSSNYGNAASLFPRVVDELFFGETSPSLFSKGVVSQEMGMDAVFSGDPIWLYAPTIGWIALGMVSGFVIYRSRNKHERIKYLLVTLIGFFSLIQICISSVLLPSEWVRQLAPYVFPLLALMALNASIYLGSKTRK